MLNDPTAIAEMAAQGPVYACVARNGAIVLAERCPPGLVPLAIGGRRRLERAICRTSRRIRGNQVVVPGLRVDLSDEAAELVVQEFREALGEQLEYGLARDKVCGRENVCRRASA